MEADCGSVKGAGVPADDDTEHYLPSVPGGESATNLIIANFETLNLDDSNSHSFSPDVHEFGSMAPWPWSPSGSATEWNGTA